MDRARRNVQAARGLVDTPYPEIALSRAYYALFYAATALLAAEGESYSKHSAVIAGYGRLFARTKRLDPKLHRYLTRAFKLRGVADYDVSVAVTPEDAREVIAWAEEFIAAAEGHLGPLAHLDDASPPSGEPDPE
jgi:uncharacterized protein (UPF0332 family)